FVMNRASTNPVRSTMKRRTLMSVRTQRHKGFTLVEILIVVVILGILAAIVIPQFTNASESAKASSLVSQLQTIGSQLELAKVQHKGAYPDLADGGWDLLTKKTDPTDSYTIPATPDGDEVGPYLQQAPKNPFSPDTSASGTTSVGGATSKTTAWAYDQTTGQIKAVVKMTADQAVALGLLEDNTETESADVVLVTP